MMKKMFILTAVLGLFAICLSCNDAPSKDKQTILTGTIKILVDESLLPIVEDQLVVFQSSYRNTQIDLLAKPENQVVSALLNDTAEIAILTRLLTSKEMSYFEARQFTPRVTKFAVDAVALVTHISNPDSVVTVADIIRVMRGEATDSGMRLVFDNPNSGTVRFLRDLAAIDTLPSVGVYALKSNKEVLKYVNDNPGTIGVVGINWIVQPDSTMRDYISNIKTLGVQNIEGEIGSDGFYKPSQSNLAEGLYPLSRPVYIINAEPRSGLGMGFAAFLGSERGQRIVLRSGLMPDSLPSREIIIRKGK